MKRRDALACGLLASLLLVPTRAASQSPKVARPYRLGFVSLASQESLLDEFRRALQDAGYAQGTHYVIDARFAEGREERLPRLVGDVVRGDVDVLVAISTATAIAAKRATAKVPIVFASVFDPVAAGLVTNLARPGGNVTGAAVGVGGGFGGKWVELLKEVAPGLSRAAVLWNPTNPSSARAVDEIRAAAPAADVVLDILDAGDAAKLENAFATIRARRMQGIIVAPDPFFGERRRKLMEGIARTRLPAIYFFKSYVDEGGLMAYGASNAASVRTAAKYVDRILKGALPGDLPVEQPTSFELAINVKTANALGLKIPQSLLVRAILVGEDR